MSTLVAQTISNGTVSTSSANVIQGCAKVWVNFDGTVATPSTIRASYNVSSVTRTGTGQYTINFTNALVDANYALVGTTIQDTRVVSISSLATSSAAIRVTNSAGALENQSIVCATIFD